MSRFALALVGGFLVVAGCAGPGAPVATMESSPVDLGSGTVRGSVLDEEVRPVPNATVTLVGASLALITAADGGFLFADVPVGDYSLVVEAATYEPFTQELRLADGEVRLLNATLRLLPAFLPYNYTEIFSGQYECAMEVVFIPGSCGILFENVTCELNNCQPDPFNSKYYFPTDVLPRWKTIIVELVWSADAGQGLDGMRLYLEHRNATSGANHGTKVARVDGTDSHLILRYSLGDVHPRAEIYEGTRTKAFIGPEGGPEQVRVFPMGKLWGTTGTVCNENIGGCLLGVGAGVGLTFTVYVTHFINGPAPADFSAVPPA